MADFLTRSERFIISYYQSPHSGSSWWGYLIGRLLLGAMFVYAMATRNNALIFSAFGMLLVLDLYVQAQQPKYTVALRNALSKYQQRLDQLESSVLSTSPQQTVEGS